MITYLLDEAKAQTFVTLYSYIFAWAAPTGTADAMFCRLDRVLGSNSQEGFPMT